MSKLDKIKESLNSLRIGLSIVSVFVLSLGGALGGMYRSGDLDFVFWFSAVLMAGFILTGIVIVRTIRNKTDELEEL
ncbi:MAG: hypothetical protein AB7E49_11220 [Campylobacterales bacterium]